MVSEICYANATRFDTCPIMVANPAKFWPDDTIFNRVAAAASIVLIGMGARAIYAGRQRAVPLDPLRMFLNNPITVQQLFSKLFRFEETIANCATEDEARNLLQPLISVAKYIDLAERTNLNPDDLNVMQMLEEEMIACGKILANKRPDLAMLLEKE